MAISSQTPSSSSLEKASNHVPVKRPDRRGMIAIRTARLRANHFNLKFNPETYDGENNIFSAVPLPTGSFKVEAPEEEGTRFSSYIFTIKLAKELQLCKLKEYLSGQLLDIPRNILQSMDLVMKENPTRRMIAFGRNFFPTESHPNDDLGYGVATCRGFQHGLKLTSQGPTLCLDYSVLAFHKRMSVIEFLRQQIRGFTLNNFQSYRRDVEDVLKGLQVNVTLRCDPLPKTLANCTSLFRLRIQNNQINGSVPTGFRLLPNLTFVDLSGDNFTGMIPEDLGNAEALSYSNISLNPLHSVLPSNIWRAPNLQIFSASSSHLTEKIPDFIGCQSLYKIELQRNDFNGSKSPDVEIPLAGHTMMHDFAIIENYVVIPDQQVVFKLGEMITGGSPMIYDKSKMSRFRILKKNDVNADDIIWVDSPDTFYFHLWNAWEEPESAEVVVIGSCRMPPDSIFNECDENLKNMLSEIRLNLKTGESSRRAILSESDDVNLKAVKAEKSRCWWRS
ncbi:hypothetical protein ACFX2J_000287 [Malus domestica]